eukprot:scaffold138545_cov102-Phaeocystis_antarctica.AAC.2
MQLRQRREDLQVGQDHQGHNGRPRVARHVVQCGRPRAGRPLTDLISPRPIAEAAQESLARGCQPGVLS